MGQIGVVLGREEKLRQIDTLASSSVLHGSESLCRLLRFLARHSLEHPGAPLKEYQIATEVFGRPADFDPRLDSTVRVQTGRLRNKLAEYYSGPGLTDHILVEIPKGAYTLSFHEREPAAVGEVRVASARQKSARWVYVALAVALCGLAASLAPSIMRSGSQPPDPLRGFWSVFLGSPEPPLIVFSNAEFVGRPETGLRYFNPAHDSRDGILDHYTGIGEVMAIHELDRLFFEFRKPIRVKRGRLLTWDEAKNSHLIFIGSPTENLSLRELPSTQEFQFKVLDSEPRKGDLAILNLHPAPGESSVYLASASIPIAEDYAVIALMAGPDPARRMLILAGITTLGTQAAVEYVCRPDQLDELRKGLAGPQTAFEALLRVHVNGGVPVHSELVALRPRSATGR